jgi:hypothetical protein
MSEKSRAKGNLKSALDALNVRMPLKLNVKAPAFEAPKPVSETRISQDLHADPEPTPHQFVTHSPVVEESGSMLNPVQNEQGSKRTGSKLDPVERHSSPSSRSTSPFTPVPHELLRGTCRFADPLDFMIYLHLFTYSWGFSRETASMSQGQLESFTGAARNTVRRSLERLTKEGWLKMVEDYECARMSRRWKVSAPENHRKSRGSNSDPVQNEPGSQLTPPRSKLNPLTGSKMNPYKERDPKEKSKNSLSTNSKKICEYFDSVLAPKKRESEQKAYLELKSSFTDSQIELCLSHLEIQGTPGTKATCHSPMAFLGQAMLEVLRSAEQESSKKWLLNTRKLNEEAERRMQRETEIRDAKEWAMKERKFLEAFPDFNRQDEVLSELCRDLPFRPQSEIGRKLAIAKWWKGQEECIRRDDLDALDK